MLYCDNNATTQPLASVCVAMRVAMESNYGNASSQHSLGRNAHRALEGARSQVAHVFAMPPTGSVVFTSSATEAINLAFLLGIRPEHTQIILSTTEHHAVLAAAHRWAGGRVIREVPVIPDGKLDLGALAAAVQAGPSFVSLIGANNETGVLVALEAASDICRQAKAVLHVDAVQMPGRVPFSFGGLGCDFASVSAHKLHGPKGCGALFIREKPSHPAPMLPGFQESGLRGGTENLPAIVGLAAAVAEIPQSLGAMMQVEKLRDRFEREIIARIAGTEVNGSAPRLPQTSNLYFAGRSAADLVEHLSEEGVCVSAGAACSNGRQSSHVIRAMGFSEARANSSVRFSFSRFTTEREVGELITAVLKCHAATPATVE